MEIFEELDEKIRESFTPVDKEKAYIIRVNGRMVEVGNNKSIWRKPGHVKLALRNHMEYIIKAWFANHLKKDWYGKEVEEKTEEYFQSVLKRNLIEIAELTKTRI